MDVEAQSPSHRVPEGGGDSISRPPHCPDYVEIPSRSVFDSRYPKGLAYRCNRAALFAPAMKEGPALVALVSGGERGTKTSSGSAGRRSPAEARRSSL